MDWIIPALLLASYIMLTSHLPDRSQLPFWKMELESASLIITPLMNFLTYWLSVCLASWSTGRAPDSPVSLWCCHCPQITSEVALKSQKGSPHHSHQGSFSGRRRPHALLLSTVEEKTGSGGFLFSVEIVLEQLQEKPSLTNRLLIQTPIGRMFPCWWGLLWIVP